MESLSDVVNVSSQKNLPHATGLIIRSFSKVGNPEVESTPDFVEGCFRRQRI